MFTWVLIAIERVRVVVNELSTCHWANTDACVVSIKVQLPKKMKCLFGCGDSTATTVFFSIQFRGFSIGGDGDDSNGETAKKKQ